MSCNFFIFFLYYSSVNDDFIKVFRSIIRNPENIWDRAFCNNNGFKPLTILTKLSFLDIFVGSSYRSGFLFFMEKEVCLRNNMVLLLYHCFVNLKLVWLRWLPEQCKLHSTTQSCLYQFFKTMGENIQWYTNNGISLVN